MSPSLVAAWRWTRTTADRLAMYLPVILMGVLALGTYWLARNTPVGLGGSTEQRTPTHDPDYFMRGFSVKSFDVDGRLKSEVFGTEARHYPDTDPQYSEIDSRMLLRDVAKKLAALKLKVVNVAATVVAEAPRMAPHMARMIGNIAADLGIAPAAVNLKATTTEGLGFVGRGEGMAAQAVVTVVACDAH